MNRRSFVQAVSLPLVRPVFDALQRPGDRLQRIGLQLYTVRDLMQADVGRTLEKVAAIGYGEVEFAGYFGESPARLRMLLDAVGLEAPSSHVSLQDLTHDPARVFDAAEVNAGATFWTRALTSSFWMAGSSVRRTCTSSAD